MLSITCAWWLNHSALWYISLPCCFSPVLLDPPAAWLQDSAFEYPKPLTLLFLWGRIWSEHSEAEEAGNRASDRRSIISTGRVRLTVFVGSTWVLAAALRNTIYVWKLSSWREKNSVENVNGCFLIQSAKSLPDSDRVSVQALNSWYWCEWLYSAMKGREESAPYYLCSLLHLFTSTVFDRRALGISKNVFLKLMKEKEFHVQFLLRFLVS